MSGTNFLSGLKSRGVPVESLGNSYLPLLPNRFLYVDGTNGLDGTNGRGPGQEAKKTLEAVRDISQAGDVIVVAPGTYTIATGDLPLTPKANQIWIAGVPSLVPNVIVTDDGGGGDTDLVDIEVANPTFVNFLFRAAHADVARLMKVADTEDVAGLNLFGCWFDGAAFATVNGVSLIDATKILTGMLMEGCQFEELDVGLAVGVKGMKNSIVRGNYFDMQDGADIGITLADTTSPAIGYRFWIHDNWFLGPVDAAADSVGIEVTDASGEDTTALGLLAKNHFAYCNVAAITPDKLSKGMVRNYVGDAGTGGTLVSPGS